MDNSLENSFVEKVVLKNNLAQQAQIDDAKLVCSKNPGKSLLLTLQELSVVGDEQVTQINKMFERYKQTQAGVAAQGAGAQGSAPAIEPAKPAALRPRPPRPRFNALDPAYRRFSASDLRPEAHRASSASGLQAVRRPFNASVRQPEQRRPFRKSDPPSVRAVLLQSVPAALPRSDRAAEPAAVPPLDPAVPWARAAQKPPYRRCRRSVPRRRRVLRLLQRFRKSAPPTRPAATDNASA